MPISSTTRKAVAPCNGSTKAFPFAFKVFEESDLRVVLVNPSGVESDLTLLANYTVALNADQDVNPGGTVTTVLAYADDYKIAVVSAVPELQPIDIVNQGGFYPEVLNEGLDRNTILTQQLSEQLARSLKLPVSAAPGDFTLPTPSGYQVLAWNDDGTGLVNLNPDELISVVTYGNTKANTFDGNGATTNFTLTDSPGSVNNLAISIDGVVQVPGTDYTWGGGTSLTFVVAPPAGTKILVRYQTALSEAPDVSSKANISLDNATTKPSATDAVSRAVYIKQREHLSVDDFNGALIDDATALTRALTAAAEGGDALPVKFFDSLNIDAPIQLPDLITLKGTHPAADQSPAGGMTGVNLEQGVLRLSSATSILGGFSSKLQDARIMRLGLTMPTDFASAATAIASMAGTAIRTGNIVGFEAENLQIIGFNRAIDFQNNGRGKLRNIKIDCTNGVRWQGSLDVSRIENVHAWPWLTATISDARALWRAGVGIEIGAPAYFTGSCSGTTLTVTAVGTGNVIVGGSTLYDGGTLVGILLAHGAGGTTGTGGTGTYALDRSVTLSSRALRARIQNDWTNVESCFTFGYQIGFTLDDTKHCTLLNCASDNAAQLLFSAYDAEAQTKIGLNVQGEAWNTQVIGFRAAAQGTGILIQPTAQGGTPWAPRVTLESPRCWGSGTYHIRHVAGEMVLKDPSTESLYGGPGHVIRLEDTIDRAVINIQSLNQPSISASATALGKTVINGEVRSVDMATADPLTIAQGVTQVRLTSAGSFGTLSDPWAYVGKRLSFILSAAVSFANGGTFRLREGVNAKLKAGDTIQFEWNGTNYIEVRRSSNQTAITTLSLPVTSQTGSFNVAVNATVEVYDDGGEFLDVFVGFLIPSGATGGAGNPGGLMYITLPNNSARGVFAHGYDPQTNLAHLVGSMVSGSGLLSIYKTGNASAIVDLANIQLRLRYRRALV